MIQKLPFKYSRKVIRNNETFIICWDARCFHYVGHWLIICSTLHICKQENSYQFPYHWFMCTNLLLTAQEPEQSELMQFLPYPFSWLPSFRKIIFNVFVSMSLALRHISSFDATRTWATWMHVYFNVSHIMGALFQKDDI